MLEKPFKNFIQPQQDKSEAPEGQVSCGYFRWEEFRVHPKKQSPQVALGLFFCIQNELQNLTVMRTELDSDGKLQLKNSAHTHL